MLTKKHGSLRLSTLGKPRRAFTNVNRCSAGSLTRQVASTRLPLKRSANLIRQGTLEAACSNRRLRFSELGFSLDRLRPPFPLPLVFVAGAVPLILAYKGQPFCGISEPGFQSQKHANRVALTPEPKLAPSQNLVGQLR